MGNQFGSPWTEELRAEVKELWKTQSAAEIAHGLQMRGYRFTRSSIIGLVHRAGLTSNNKTETTRRGPRKGDKGTPRKLKPVIRLIGGNSGGVARFIRRFEPEAIELRCVEVVPRHLSLADLEPDDCRYAYGDGGFTFCGHPKQEGSSYCQAHHALCWEPRRPKQELRAA